MSAPDPPRAIKDWVQVDASHYGASYLAPWRMAAIGYQVQLALKQFPRASFLEVGLGAGLTRLLLEREGCRVRTLDVDEHLHPDLLGSVTEIPADDGAFDACICCQVLEHLPWDLVPQALNELHRVVRHGGVISVPTVRPTWLLMKYDSRSWGTRRIHLRFRARRPLRHTAEHHWELEANVSTRAFEQRLTDAGFRIERRLQPAECMYHQFFVLSR